MQAESSVQSLQSELNYYRQNQPILETEIRTLIDDNTKLSQHIKSLLKERAELARSECNIQQTDTKLDELKYHVALLTKEKESLSQLWETSQSTIEALETELKAYHNEYYHDEGNTSQGSRTYNIANKNIEVKFNTALEEINILENKLKETAAKEQEVTKELRSKEEEIKSHKENEKMLETKIEQISAELEESKYKLITEQNKSKDIEKVKNDLDMSIRREIEAKNKVKEALDLLDVVTEQKDDAYNKALAAAEELMLVKTTITDIKSEIEARLRSELDGVKDKYDEKISDMLSHIQTLDEELVEKGLLLAKIMRENKILQRSNESFVKQQTDTVNSVDPKLAMAEQRLDAAFQELVLSERRNIQLISEKQCIALDMQRLRDSHTRDMKRRDWEEQLLRTEISDFKLQIDHLQKSLQETHGLVNKLQALLSNKSDLNERIVSSKQDEVLELNQHVQKQIELNKKWRQSYVEMKEKLKSRLEELHNENLMLKLQNTSILEYDGPKAL